MDKDVKKYNLRINNPCHENWDDMSPTEQGKFCGVCATEVVDFVAMTDEQVQQFFANYQGGHLCGRIRQEETILPLRSSPLVAMPQFQPSHWRKIAATLLFATSLSACQSSAQELEKITPAKIPIKTEVRHGKTPPKKLPVEHLLKTMGIRGGVYKQGVAISDASVSLYSGDELLAKVQTSQYGLFTLSFPDINSETHKNLRIQVEHINYAEVRKNVAAKDQIPLHLNIEIGEPIIRKGEIKVQD